MSFYKDNFGKKEESEKKVCIKDGDKSRRFTTFYSIDI
jgi:hypothetical protein